MALGEDRTPVVLADYDPAWPAQFVSLANLVRAALGPTALAVHHVGSTAVPGLAAKPVIDVALVVADSSDEGAYREALERIGFTLVVREPDWFEHRMFQRPDPLVNLHVYSTGCEEVTRLLAFRDWLRGDEDDRVRYAMTKQDLAGQRWKSVQEYADAKTDVIAGIVARALAARDPDR